MGKKGRKEEGLEGGKSLKKEVREVRGKEEGREERIK